MKRRSRAGGEPIKARRRKTATLKRSTAPKDGRRRSSSAATHETEVARLTRELNEAREQQTASSGRVWCNAALAYALACAAETEPARKTHYADRAAGMLRRAWSAGFFRPGAAVRAFAADPNLDAVRAGPAFRRLIADAAG